MKIGCQKEKWQESLLEKGFLRHNKKTKDEDLKS